MAFNRKIELVIGPGASGVLVSDLNMDFRVEKSIFNTNNHAEFTIYNAAESTRNNFLKKDSSVIFKAGYEDETVEHIFSGNVFDATHEKQGPLIKTKLVCISRNAKQPLEKLYLSVSYSKGTFLSVPMRELANALGIAIFGASNVQFPLPNGFAYAGSAQGLIRYVQQVLATLNIVLYIDKNEMVIYKKGDPSKYEVVALSYNSGLISVQDVVEKNTSTDPAGSQVKRVKTKKKIPKKEVEFKCILNPKIQPNSPVLIKANNKLDGTYAVNSLVYEGDNHGGAFDITGRASQW